MSKSGNLNNSVIFPKGGKVTNGPFTGDVWLEMLAPKDDTFNCPIANVMFAPGARTDWHKHPGGQLLLVTGGKGYSKEQRMLAKVIQESDVEKVPPNVKHWHNAASESWLVHISITPNAQKGDAEWLEPVADEEYSKERNEI